MKARATWSINGRFLTQSQTGVQRYAGEMTREIDLRLGRDDELAAKLAFEICLPADCTADPRFANIAVRRGARGSGHAWEQLVLPRMARGGLLSFANLGPLAHGRQIVCLHDANVFISPESYARGFGVAYRTAFPLLARRARAVTTVSAFSAAMLRDFGVTGATPARVIHNGHEHALRWDRKASRFDQPARFERPFVFALGSRAKHKQLDLLLGLAPALDALGLDLIISGGTASIFTEAALTRTANVFPVGFVSDDDLASLFAQALCFAFPSRTEGFGLPLIEAMVHGAPIVSSDAASMPEVCATPHSTPRPTIRRPGSRGSRGSPRMPDCARRCAPKVGRGTRGSPGATAHALISTSRWRCRRARPASRVAPRRRASAARRSAAQPGARA